MERPKQFETDRIRSKNGTSDDAIKKFEQKKVDYKEEYLKQFASQNQSSNKGKLGSNSKSDKKSGSKASAGKNSANSHIPGHRFMVNPGASNYDFSNE
mmetsp:Transcript_24707/g.21877  ORF Transcript_24707/g.21877 Transcript_24707/m.21877 type:complete len:98 (-) Transcript_24707:149-442(-)